MKKEPTLVVVALVESHEPRGDEPTYILTRRKQDAHLAGFWEFPGGKVEPGESPVEALKRELMEELGVQVEALEPTVFSYHEYSERHVLILFYRAQLVAGSPRPQPLEASELKLMTRTEVLKLPMPPANEVFLRYLRQSTARS